MSKKEMIETLTALKGIGTAKAEALVDAGYDSIEKIKAASTADLTSVQGISETVATSLQQQLKDITSSKKKQQSSTKKPQPTTKKTSEKPKGQQPSTTKEIPAETKKPIPQKKTTKGATKKKKGKKEGYIPKQKPELSNEIKQSLCVRKNIKKRTPRFYREEWFRYKRLGTSWRRPDGITSKMRRNLKYRPNKVRVGYRGPEKTRGLHPSGFKEVMVFNADDISGIDPKTQAARISGTVGMKKRLEIEKKAEELNVRVLNRQR